MTRKRCIRGGVLGSFGVMLYIALVRWGLLMPPSMIPGFFCLPSCPEISHVLSEDQIVLDDPRSLSSLLDQDNTPEQISLLIEKSKYRLTLFDQGEQIKSYGQHEED